MAGDKKIMELSILNDADVDTWQEVTDMDEVDPDLQNKRMKKLDPLRHIQGTDQFLDEGGSNEVNVPNLAIHVNRSLTFAWIYSEITAPSSSGFMRFGVDIANQRIVFINPSALAVTVGEIFTGMASGVYLHFTFNKAGGNILVKTTTSFVLVSGWLQAVCDVVDDNFNDIEGSVGVVTIIKN
jgi:hypothetical protein